MPTEHRVSVTDPEALEALANPLRLDLLSHLMDEGPATASACGRAVGASPSNCSYHLRVLARHGLVESVDGGDGRERPWRALVTGIVTDPAVDGAAGAVSVAEASLRLDQQIAQEHLRTMHQLSPAWREASGRAGYGLRVSPAEMRELLEGVDALLRPYIGATRDDAPTDAATVHVSVLAVPRRRRA